MLIDIYRSNKLVRLIQSGSAGKDRILFERGIILAIHELSKQTELNQITYDLVAYIVLSLKAIGNTIDGSVSAWEKRGYWLKADRYRIEWSWTITKGEELEQALSSEEWGRVSSIIAQITQKMSKVKVSTYSRLGTPWIGSWEKLRKH